MIFIKNNEIKVFILPLFVGNQYLRKTIRFKLTP